MKQAVELPTLKELVALLAENYWKANNAELPKELLTLKEAESSLESLATVAKKLNTKTAFYTPKSHFRELYTLIIAVHQNDTTKGSRLLADIQFKISVWNWEQALALAMQSKDIAAQSKACLELGLLYKDSSQEMQYEQALSYFSRVIKLGHLKETPLACRRRAELYFQRGFETSGLKDLEAFCRLDPDNPRAQIEYGQALIVAGRHKEAEKAAKQALLIKPNDPAANDLLQIAQRHSPTPERESKVDVNDNATKYQARDELHRDYLRQLSSDMRRDAFRQLMQALNRCKNSKAQIASVTELMSEANLEQLLACAPQCLAVEMPEHDTKLQADCRADQDRNAESEVPQSFEDCLILYLATTLSGTGKHYASFYQNISQLLAHKGYYYQDIAVKNTGNPIDALDYGLLALPYDSPELLAFYQAGASQIVVEYHYYQGSAILQSAERALKNCETTLQDRDAADFLKQFELLLNVTKFCSQYQNSAALQTLQKECGHYLSSTALLKVFEKTFRFKLRHYQTQAQLLKNQCAPLLALIDSWGQQTLANAKAALRAFDQYLDERLPTDPFYDTAKAQTAQLLLRFQKSQPLLQLAAVQPDMTRLIQETRKRFAHLLTLGQNVNQHSVAEVQKQISVEAKGILTSLLTNIEYTLGTAPCAFSILGLGSYSRGEMSLCSDIDFAILVSDGSSVHHPYFKSFLSLLVHLRRGLPSNVLTIESKDLQTIFGQEKSLLHTPFDMVSEHCPLLSQENIASQRSSITNTESYSIRRAMLIFNSQTQSEESEQLLTTYQRLLTTRLQTTLPDAIAPYYQTVGQLCFAEDFKKQDGAELVDTTPSHTINLKKTHLRPLTLWILDVGTYFGIEDNNTWAILEKLKLELRLAPIFLQELNDALAYLHTLRLKLHHAWLTQPRPAELLFDAWLEMSTNGNVATEARDFYLNHDQQNILDAIQRRIVEPLIETIAVFGATHPTPQFDPVEYYFKQQFQAFNASKPDQKDIAEPNLKTLSTLAEIALRRPHLLQPSPAFRDLLPGVKVAYLDALEAIKREGSTKEIAELKTLIQTLWHTPTEDGWRAESFRQERAWHQQLLRLASTEVSSPASSAVTFSFVEDNRVKHYALKPEIASQFFTTQGTWQPKDAKIEGNHLVYRILNAVKTETLCWAKIYPEQPGIEWLMLNLDQRLGVYGIPASTLVNLHHNGQNTAVLFSLHVPHPNLLSALEKNPKTLSELDPAHFFKTLIRVLLSNPEDDKGNDYFLESSADGLKLIRIDNERAFFAAESSSGLLTKAKLQVKTIIYCLDLLIKPLTRNNPRMDAAIQDFLRLKPYALLKNLLLDLNRLQPLWQQLFSESDIKIHYQNQMPWLSLPLLYVPSALLKELFTRMESLQNLIAFHPKITGLELLETTQHTLAEHYKQGFKSYQNQNYSTVLARFNLSPGQHYKKEEGRTVSMHGTKAISKSLGLSEIPPFSTVKLIWQGKIYAASDLLKQIEQWEQTRAAEVFNGLIHPDPKTQSEAQVKWQQLPNRQRALLFNEFSAWVRKNPAANINMQQSILSALANTTFHSLDLSAFSESLEDKFLIPILKTGGTQLVALSLSHCQKLSETIPAAISEYCPNLKTLSLCNMAWKSFSTGLRGWSPVLLPKVERLEMQNCKALEYFITDALPQADIILQGCTALKHVQFSADISFVAAKQLRPGEYQYQLAKAYSSGTGISKNLIQAYYWARLSLEQNHPSASELCRECAYAVAKSYLLGDGILKDINQAYHWARLSREHQHPLSEMLCYALFNFYAVTPLNGSDESLFCEKNTVSLVGEPSFASIQTLKNVDVKTLELGHILENISELGLALLSFTPAVNSSFTHVNWQYNKTSVPDVKTISEAQKNTLRPDSTLEKLLMQCERLAALSLDAVPVTYLGKSGLLSASPLILPHLRSLTLRNLDKLTRFLLQTPQLTILSLQDLPQLIDVRLEAPQLRNLEIRRCDALESLETHSEEARMLLYKGIALSAEDPKKAAEQLDNALSLEPNHILRLIEIEQSLTQTLPDYISRCLRVPEPSILTPQFTIVQRQGIQQLNTFLALVAEGEQDKAEALLQKHPAFGLCPGDVTDLSKRTFKNITALQYALWSLDWHMWTMLLKYIPQKDAAEQIAQSERGLWVPQHGVSASWQNLLDALQKYIDLCNASKWSEAATQWDKQVGSLQRLLPAHVINEYCRPDRSFKPCPDFNSSTPLARTRNTDGGEWYTAYDGKLGDIFAYVRYSFDKARAVAAVGGVVWYAAADLKSCRTLLATRVQQRDQLFAELSVTHQAQAKAGVR